MGIQNDLRIDPIPFPLLGLDQVAAMGQRGSRSCDAIWLLKVKYIRGRLCLPRVHKMQMV